MNTTWKDEFMDTDSVLFKNRKEIRKVNPTNDLMQVSKIMKQPWTSRSVRTKYLTNKYTPATTYRKTRQQKKVYIPYRIYEEGRESLSQLLCPMDEEPMNWRVGLFVNIPGHTFSLVVDMTKDSTSKPFIKSVLVMDTVILTKKAYAPQFDAIDAAVAMALKDVSCTSQDLFDILKRVHRPIIGRIFYLQKNEQGGYCQHWNTYFLYQVLVKHEDPNAMFNRLAAMGYKRTEELIRDFANEAVNEYTPSIPLQMESPTPREREQLDFEEEMQSL